MRHGMMLLLLAAVVGRAVALDPVAPLAAEGLVAAGQRLEEQGEWASAAEQYRAAVRIRPDYLAGYLRLVAALKQMLPQAAREAEQAALAQQIREAYAAAAKCPDATWRVYSEWAAFLVEVVVPRAATAMERQLVFEEALLLTDSAMLQGPQGADLARTQLQRAMLLVVMAPEIADGERQLRMYAEANELFEAVAKTTPEVAPARWRDNWAVALLHYGRLNRDRGKKEMALEWMRSAVAETPTDVVRRYNLACGYASVGEDDAAYAELAKSLEGDRSGRVFEAVTKDAEWARWRTAERFQKLLARHDPAVDAAYARGRDLQVAVDRMGNNQAIAKNLRQAIAAYRTVVAARPDFHPAWWNLAVCCHRLGALTDSVEDRRSWWQSAREAYREAANAPRAGAATWQAWGRFETREMGVLVAGNSAAQEQVLREGREILEEALRRTDTAGDRARVQLDLAAAEVRLGRLAPGTQDRLRWFEQAVARLHEVVKRDELAATATPYALWGLAQLETGRIQRNRLVLRGAVERFLTAIERAPTDPEIRYNLACTYALLAQADEALRHLQICLENDPNRRFVTVAQADRDFDNIRNLPAFAELLRSTTGAEVVMPGPAPARISDY